MNKNIIASCPICKKFDENYINKMYNNDTECCICMERKCNVSLHCGHIFCDICVDKFTKNMNVISHEYLGKTQNHFNLTKLKLIRSGSKYRPVFKAYFENTNNLILAYFRKNIFNMKNLDESYIKQLTNKNLNYIGKLSSNYLKNKYVIYTNSVNNINIGKIDIAIKNNFRKINVKIPFVNDNGKPTITKTNYLEFKNKKPGLVETQNEGEAFGLYFGGRCSIASSKNFQIEDGRKDIILQLGKIGNNIYNLDYAYPFNAFQAFGIAISQFI